jgi:hypothetical protein
LIAENPCRIPGYDTEVGPERPVGTIPQVIDLPRSSGQRPRNCHLPSGGVNGQLVVPVCGQLKVSTSRVVLAFVDLGSSLVSGLAHTVAFAVGDDDVAVV